MRRRNEGGKERGPRRKENSTTHTRAHRHTQTHTNTHKGLFAVQSTKETCNASRFLLVEYQRHTRLQNNRVVGKTGLSKPADPALAQLGAAS